MDKIQIEYNNDQVSFKGKKTGLLQKRANFYVKKFGELVLKNII